MIISLLFALAVGAIAGWIASKLVAGAGFGLGTAIVVGMVGAAIARLIFPFIGLPGGLIASIFHATFDAVILLVLVRLVKRIQARINGALGKLSEHRTSRGGSDASRRRIRRPERPNPPA